MTCLMFKKFLGWGRREWGTITTKQSKLCIGLCNMLFI